MVITKITYGESYEAVNSYGLKSWNKLGVEIEMEAGESADEAYQTAHQFIKEKLSKQMEEEPVIQKRQEPKNENQKIAQYVSDLLLCRELEGKDGLLSFDAFVKQIDNQTVTSAYEMMYKKLSK